jgi:hypothetical protein
MFEDAARDYDAWVLETRRDISLLVLAGGVVTLTALLVYWIFFF